MMQNCDSKFRSLPFQFVLAIVASLIVTDVSDAQVSITNHELAVGNSDEIAVAEELESWDVMQLAGKRIGYRRWRSVKSQRDGEAIYVTTSEEHLLFRRFGQTARISSKTKTVEEPNGDLLEFDFEMANPPNSSSRATGKVEGNSFKIEITTAGRTKKMEIPWRTGIKSPLFQERLFRTSPPDEKLNSSTEVFFPELNKVGKVKTVGDRMVETKLFDGTAKKLLRIKSTISLMPLMSIDGYVSPEGDILKTETNMIGQKMVVVRVSREEAIKKIVGEELDLAIETLVKPDKPLVKSHRSKKSVYKIHLSTGDPTKLLPGGSSQSLERIDANTTRLTVVSLDVPDYVAKGKSIHREFLESNNFIQADDSNVIQHARKAASGSISAPRIAKSMESYVFKKLTKKNFSTAMATAAEVAKNLQGDCTEHSVLLAAMLRAKGIPSRVAVGLVYAEPLQAFAGHMWTEAWLGDKWIPLDATMGRGGISAAHIKLGDASFKDSGPAAAMVFVPLMNIIGNLKIELISEE